MHKFNYHICINITVTMESAFNACRIGGGKKLDLSNFKLHEFPKDIFEFSDTLEELNLGGNHISNLPDNFDLFIKL